MKSYGECRLCGKEMYEEPSTYMMNSEDMNDYHQFEIKAHSNCIEVKRLKIRMNKEINLAYERGRESMLKDIQGILKGIYDSFFQDLVKESERCMKIAKYAMKCYEEPK